MRLTGIFDAMALDVSGAFVKVDDDGERDVGGGGTRERMGDSGKREVTTEANLVLNELDHARTNNATKITVLTCTR
jgi:hypothetical protein